MKREPVNWMPAWRRRFVLLLCAFAALGLAGRAVDLQVVRSEFLQDQAKIRHVRTVPIPAHRGMLLDRHGEPLAVSTPVWSIWADPRALIEAPEQWAELASALDMPVDALGQRVRSTATREFIWLRRHLSPNVADDILALNVPGVGRRQEFRRYYPTAEVGSHLTGFTGIDDAGQEGMELAYDSWLTGRPGRKRVVVDRLGRVIADVEMIRPAERGRDLALSIDRRMQYLAYRELKAAVVRNGARGGSLIMLDVHTGEVLAMVNQPSFNPNDGRDRAGGDLRNRAVTDTFEPGSTMKAFTIAAALETGRYESDTPVFTAPGHLRVAGHTITDERHLGELDVAGVLRMSSNPGASRIALSLPDRALWSMLAAAGLGESSGSGFPGEAVGRLPPPGRWGPVETATIAFGYGVSVTPLQLVRAYAAIAADGLMPEVTLRRLSSPDAVERHRVMSAHTARRVRTMLESVVAAGGTGSRAQITGYRVAGKTGTAHKATAGGYASDEYLAVFAGFAPASDPRIAAVVVLDEPAGEEYYGGQVAAPVFGRVMADALRLLDIRPDDLPGEAIPVVAEGGAT